MSRPTSTRPTTDDLIDCVYRLTMQKDQLQHDVILLLAQLQELKYEKCQRELEEANASVAKLRLLDAKAKADHAKAQAVRVAAEASAKKANAKLADLLLDAKARDAAPAR